VRKRWTIRPPNGVTSARWSALPLGLVATTCSTNALQPGATIRHAHGPTGGADRAQLRDQFEQLHLSRSEANRVAEVQSERQTSLSVNHNQASSGWPNQYEGDCSQVDCGARMSVPPLVLVRGIGDVGSAVAHTLLLGGYAVAISDGPAQPTTHRRGMAFTDAVFDGTAKLDGVYACKIDTLDSLPAQASGRLFISPHAKSLFEARTTK
jgi:hypothetical protein